MPSHARLSLLALAACAIAAYPDAAPTADDARYVSISGSNANPCTLALPCRTLQRGINQTPAGGELHILSSGSYGNNANIDKSLTIFGNGNTVYPVNPLTIDAPGAAVALRGLVLNGQGTVFDGITIVAASAVTIERCVIHNFVEQGIQANAAGLELFVTDTTSRDNGAGLVFLPAAGAPSRVTIDNSRFNSNATYGIWVLGGFATISRTMTSGNGTDGIDTNLDAVATVASTVAAHNGNVGFKVDHTLGTATMTIDSSLASGNGEAGMRVTGVARISASTITDNPTGIINVDGFGITETRRNNTVRGNTTDVSGTLTPIPGR